jgi:hypothetical protein
MSKFIVQRRGSTRTFQPLARGCKISVVWDNVVHCSTNSVPLRLGEPIFWRAIVGLLAEIG